MDNAMAVAKKSNTYATRLHISTGHLNCQHNHSENGAAHNRALSTPRITAKMAIISDTKPRIRPLTKPTERGSSNIASNQLIVIA
jgi:hypothetical protein